MTRRLTHILAFLLPALLAYLVGWLALGRHLVDWNTLAAAAHAADVFHKLPQANLALIGFVQPPLPALLYLPLSYLCPGWLAGGGAAPVLGALFLGLTTLSLVRLGQALRVPTWLTATVAVLFTIHPLVLSYAALGHPGIILIFTYAGLARGLTMWRREQTVRDLVAAAIYGAAAILISYEAVVPVLAAALVVLSCCRRGAGGAARAEGTLIAFLLPAAYVAAVWLTANWAIMGSPLHFWRTTLADAQHLPLVPVDSWIQPLMVVALAVQPLLMALIYHDLRPSSLPRTGTPVAWVALAALASPLLLPTLRTSATGAALWGPLLPVAAACAAFGFVLLLTLGGSYIALALPDRRKLLSGGIVIIGVGAMVLAFYLQSTGQGLPTGLRSTLRGYAASAHTDLEEHAAALLLRQRLQRGVRNYIAGWPGFAIALYGRLESEVSVLPAATPPPGDLGLQAGSRLVLLRNGGDHEQAWAARLPRHLTLTQEWNTTKWIGYAVALRAATPPPSKPQPSARPASAIIPAEVLHAHPRH